MCENSTVEVCSGERRDKWLKTQYINKSLPAPDEYPVRVFVNITYSSLTCPPRMMCDKDFELHIARSDMKNYSKDGIMPSHMITYSPDVTTQHLYFDLNEGENGFSLGLKSRHKGVCVSVSRVLVYRYECPEQATGLAHYPATQAPANGTVPAMPYCVENSHHSEMSQPDKLVCTAEGNWINDQTECVCNAGYTRDSSKCEGIINETLHTAHLPYEPHYTLYQFMIHALFIAASTTPSNQPTGKSVTVTVAPTTPSDTLTGGTTTSVTQTSTLTPNTPTTSPTDTSDTEDDGAPSTVFAVVGVMMVVIIALILIVILLMIFLVRKNRKQQDG